MKFSVVVFSWLKSKVTSINIYCYRYDLLELRTTDRGISCVQATHFSCQHSHVLSVLITTILLRLCFLTKRQRIDSIFILFTSIGLHRQTGAIWSRIPRLWYHLKPTKSASLNKFLIQTYFHLTNIKAVFVFLQKYVRSSFRNEIFFCITNQPTASAIKISWSRISTFCVTGVVYGNFFIFISVIADR